MTTAKKSARDLIDQMPEEASWDDIMYELYVKQKIESGIQDVSEGRVAAHEDIKARLLQRKRLAS
jgi:predicted transcriptional regulator